MKKSLLIFSVASFLIVGLSACSSKEEATIYSFNLIINGEGNVEGTTSGNYEEGTVISLTSAEKENSGYIFDGFYQNDILMEIQNTYTFTLNKDVTVVANFILDPNEEPDKPVSDIKTNATYGHIIKSGEFSTSGGKTETINGLSWEYDSSTYCGFETERGLQIGSSKNPQTSTWSMTTNFPEGVYITGYDIYLCNGSKGSGKYEISFGTYKKSSEFSVFDPTSFAESELSESASSFSISLSADSKALYIKSIEIDFYVPTNIDFDVTTDNGDIDEPDNPSGGDTEDKPKTNYDPITVDEYYKDIDFNQSSAEVFTDLNEKLNAQFTGISYGDAREILCYTDQVVGDSNHLYSLLDGDLLNDEWDQGATWNREHVWPKSLLGVSDVNNRDINIATDLMNLRAACTNANSSHGNRYYGEKGEANAFYPNVTSGLSGTHSYTGDHRGDVARICFYMALKYDGTISLSDNPSGSYQNGYLSTLIKWDKEDPVDAFEIQRNNRIYEYQGNRNPFVDFYDKGLAELFF